MLPYGTQTDAPPKEGTQTSVVICEIAADRIDQTWEILFLFKFFMGTNIEAYATVWTTWQPELGEIYPDKEETVNWLKNDVVSGVLNAMDADDMANILYKPLKPVYQELLRGYFETEWQSIIEHQRAVMDEIYDNAYGVPIPYEGGFSELFVITFDILQLVLKSDIIMDGSYIRQRLEKKCGLASYFMLEKKVTQHFSAGEDMDLTGMQYLLMREYMNLAAWLLCSSHEQKLREEISVEDGYVEEDIEWYLRNVSNILRDNGALEDVVEDKSVLSLIEWEE
jgi:hypothetical protein